MEKRRKGKVGGPSFSKLEQIKGKGFTLFVFFNQRYPISTDIAPGRPLLEHKAKSTPSPVKKSGNLPVLQSTVFPKSVSVTDLLKAGKLVKPPATNITMLDLESFDVTETKWV